MDSNVNTSTLDYSRCLKPTRTGEREKRFGWPDRGHTGVRSQCVEVGPIYSGMLGKEVFGCCDSRGVRQHGRIATNRARQDLRELHRCLTSPPHSRQHIVVFVHKPCVGDLCNSAVLTDSSQSQPAKYLLPSRSLNILVPPHAL